MKLFFSENLAIIPSTRRLAHKIVIIGSQFFGAANNSDPAARSMRAEIA
jgi:hypothetical protein